MPGDDNSVALPQSRRPDGSLRKEVRVKKGYVPPEEQKTYDRFKDTTPQGVLGAETNDEAPKKSKNKNKKKKPEGGAAEEQAEAPPAAPAPVVEAPAAEAPAAAAPAAAPTEVEKKIKALKKRLRGIEDLQMKQTEGTELNADQLSKIAAKAEVEAEIEKWEALGDVDLGKKIKNLKKKVKQIEDLEEKLKNGLDLNEDQQSKIDAKGSVLQELKTLEDLQ